jgi:hypothetical protein
MDAVLAALFCGGEEEVQQQRHQHAIGAADHRPFEGEDGQRLRYGHGVGHANHIRIPFAIAILDIL